MLKQEENHPDMLGAARKTGRDGGGPWPGPAAEPD